MSPIRPWIRCAAALRPGHGFASPRCGSNCTVSARGAAAGRAGEGDAPMPDSRGPFTRAIQAGRQAVDGLGASAAASDHGYLLKVVQPALLGMMDGSISTLAPLFASAFATRSTHTA